MVVRWGPTAAAEKPELRALGMWKVGGGSRAAFLARTIAIVQRVPHQPLLAVYLA
jgi:hypothetical protein